MQCHNCNNERPADAAFCPTCGARTVEASGTAATPTVMVTGEAPAAAPPPIGHIETSEGSATSLAPVVMVAVVVVALVLGGVAFLTTRDSQSGNGDAATTDTPTTVDNATVETPVASTTTPSPTTSIAPSTTASTTTTTTTSTTTTTTSTTTTLSPDPQTVAQSELRRFIDADRPRLESLLGNWLPQVSAKQVGEVWPGPYLGIDEPFPYRLSDIVAEHRVLDERFGVVMANGSEFNFRFGGNETSQVMNGWYITLVDQPFATAQGALDWCRANNIDRDNCAAKFITDDQDAGATLVLQ